MEVRKRNSGAQQRSHPRAPLLEWAPPRANVLAASERLMIKRRGYFCLCFFPTTARASLPQALLGNNILGEVSCLCGSGSDSVSDRFPHFIFAPQGRIFAFEISGVNFRA